MAHAQSDSSVFGVFEGRSPCQELARELNTDVSPDCFKLKWKLTLYKDAHTGKPAMYKIEGTLYRKETREGKWEVIKGTKANPHAVVYKLEPGNSQGTIFFLKGDDNILFFLDADDNLLAGNSHFSYTLNRVQR
jgi:hypothetical protein